MGTYWRKYGILKFKINFKWLYSFSLFLEKAPCSSNDKEQTQRKEVFTGTGKFCIMFVKSLNNKQYLLGLGYRSKEFILFTKVNTFTNFFTAYTLL